MLNVIEAEKQNEQKEPQEQLKLDDARRVKVLSPGMMVFKRFIRNKLAIAGIIILAFMFLFSFLGGVISPYGENQQFYRVEYQNKDYAGVVQNEEFRYAQADGQKFDSVLQAQFVLAYQKGNDTFTYRDVEYGVYQEGEDFYRITLAEDDTTIGMAYKDIVTSSVEGQKVSFDVAYNALLAFTNDETEFSAEGGDYTIDEAGVVTLNGEEIAFISRYVVNPIMSDVFLSRDFQEELVVALEEDVDEFVFTDADGETHTYTISYRPDMKTWSVMQATETRVYDTYASPSKAHWLGTDRNGMDMLTRLMYGGRVSLIIGFIVEFISSLLGVIMGGLAGYFGKWVDNLIMRIVDIFYCIPSMPIIIILGAAVDAMSVEIGRAHV